jgi:dTDP-glucose 4,6-dehydratase
MDSKNRLSYHHENRDRSGHINRVLVTGGAGFIGSNFVRFLLQAEPHIHITNLDALTYAGNIENLGDLPDPSRHTFVHGDIRDRSMVEALFRQAEIDTVVHFAAETHVDRSILDPELFVTTNILGTFNLLESARKVWLAEKTLPLERIHFHHVSTDEVFGSLSLQEPAWNEDTPYAPNSPYSASKAASDHLARAYHHTYGLPVTITNCSNNYGPFMFPEKLIPLMIFNALEGRPLPVYGDGEQVRDWLYVEDHCAAIWAVVKRGKVGDTYNIGGGNQPSNITVVQTLCDILDECAPQSPYIPHSQLICFVPDRPGHDRRYAMDITKIQHELGWKPSQTLASGLLKTVTWYLENPTWVETVRKRPDYREWLQRNYEKRGGEQ